MDHCFYHHNCMDGWASAAIVFEYGYVSRFNFHSSKYDDVVDLDMIEKGSKVYIVDFSFAIEVMKAIDKKADLIWCDHHITALEAAEKADFHPSGIRNIKLAGGELTWQYFNKDIKIPECLELLGKYDTWRYTENEKERVMDFRFGLETYDLSITSSVWKKIFNDSRILKSQVLIGGHAVNIFKDKRNKIYCEDYAFETSLKVHGVHYNVIAMSTPDNSSVIFDSVYDPDKHDLITLYR